MPALHILSLALAAAFLAGINLYLTVFLAGLAGQLGWLPVTGDGAVIGILTHPAVMTVAVLLYVLDAIIDKIPAVDSLWDTLHTVIRPAGAVLLALHIMGSADPAYQALAGILAGIIALTTHLAKASSRLLINNSPGPLLNILASLGEDLFVLGLGSLAVHKPLAGFIVCLSLTVLLWLLFPRMFRVARASLWLMWKKVRLPAGAMTERVKLPAKISADQDMLLHGQLPGACTVEWAVRCITGRPRRSPGVTAGLFGSLISVREHPASLVFIGRRWFRHRPVRVSLAGCEVQHESGFLSENLVIYHKADRRQMTFRFARAEEALAAKLEEQLRRQCKEARAETGPVEPAEAVPPAEQTIAPASVEEGPAFALPPLIQEAPPEAAAPVPAADAEPIPAFPAPGQVSAPEAVPADFPKATADVPPMPVTDEPAQEKKDTLA